MRLVGKPERTEAEKAEAAGSLKSRQLLLTCRRCGHEANNEPGEWALDGLCTTCALVEAIKPYRAEITRLVAKRERYSRAAISTAALDQQLAGLIRRAERKALDLAPSQGKQLRQVMQEVLGQISTEVMYSQARILRA